MLKSMCFPNFETDVTCLVLVPLAQTTRTLSVTLASSSWMISLKYLKDAAK